MDPVSIGFGVSAATTALGAITSAEGSKQAGEAKARASMSQAASYEAQAKMEEYKAGVARVNKQIAEQNKDYSLKIGETQAQAEGMKTRFQVGEARASGGASGLDVNRGSKARVIESTEAVGEQGQAVVRADAAKRAYGYDVEATNLEAQAKLDEMGASNLRIGVAGATSAAADYRTAGDIGATASLLGGASSVASKWTQASSAGMFGKSTTDWAGDSGYKGWIDNPDASKLVS